MNNQFTKVELEYFYLVMNELYKNWDLHNWEHDPIPTPELINKIQSMILEQQIIIKTDSVSMYGHCTYN